MAVVDPARAGGKRGRRQPSQLLRDMRLVYKSKGKEGDERLRQIYADDYLRFIDRLERLEKVQAARRAKAEAQAGGGAPRGGADSAVTGRSDTPPPADLGTQACLALIDELLGEATP